VTPPRRARELIEQLALQPHPEGGFYREVHRSSACVAPLDGRPARAALTSIYFLLVEDGISRWHRVASDEVWLHLEGAPVVLHLLDEPTRALRRVQLGPLAGEAVPQCTVAAGSWQAAQLDGAHALLACVVAPGFEFSDFAMMEPAAPLAAWLRDAHPALARLL
jgi:predicted cupin superfamily sugar epimerase